jgi:SAM-dependent methyltransferase
MSALRSSLKWALKAIGYPLRIGTSWLPHGAEAGRYFMYEKLSTVVNEPNQGVGKKVLSISYSRALTNLLGLGKAEVIEANYPEHNALNLTGFGSNEFDYVISDQVLEHVEGNPQAVFDESLRVLKPGGIAVHTTVFFYPIHGYPSDFWRFSPDALKLLAKNFSEVVEVGGFGNRALFIIDLLGLHTVPTPHAKWHPLHIVATTNMKGWPSKTWIVARK